MKFLRSNILCLSLSIKFLKKLVAKRILFSTMIFLPLIFASCSEKDESSSSASSSPESIASTVIAELSASLSSSSSSRQSRVSSRSASKTLSNSLTSSQITLVVDAATAAVTAASLGSSTDLIQIMPKIIEGSQGKLATVGLSNSSEKIKVINVIGNSLVKSIKGRSSNLPSTSAESGSTITSISNSAGCLLKTSPISSMSGVFEVVSDWEIGNGSPLKGELIYLPMRDGMEFDKEGKVIAMCSNGVILE